jgi:hypothetical protein
MGTGRIVIRAGARKHVISYIATKSKGEAYNRTPRAIIGEAMDYPFHGLLVAMDIPVEQGQAYTKLFHLMQTIKIKI